MTPHARAVACQMRLGHDPSTRALRANIPCGSFRPRMQGAQTSIAARENSARVQTDPASASRRPKPVASWAQGASTQIGAVA